MNTLIIDDHKINRLYLKSLLKENFPLIEKVDEVDSVSDAISMFEAIDYDLIFLDMELKDGMGFDVLKKVKDFVYVIVVTSHKEYAIQAFKYNVADYILKPLDLNEFRNAVLKVMKLKDKEDISKKPATPAGLIERGNKVADTLMINYKGEYVALNKQDILFIKALGKYSEIHITDRKHYTSYKNLKEFEIEMADAFVRTHHSYLVNCKSIVSFSRDTSQVVLTSGEMVPVSVRKREDLFKKFKVF